MKISVPGPKKFTLKQETLSTFRDNKGRLWESDNIGFYIVDYCGVKTTTRLLHRKAFKHNKKIYLKWEDCDLQLNDNCEGGFVSGFTFTFTYGWPEINAKI